jgi:hypothetical protein
MNKRVLLGSMIVLVLVIWATVVYKLVKSPDQNLLIVEATKEVEASDNLPPAMQKLNLDYVDPFLKVSRPGQKAVNFSGSEAAGANRIRNLDKVMQHEQQSELTFQWPSIQYQGIIHNQSNNQLLALVSVDGNNQIAQLNDYISGLHVLDISKESIRLKSDEGEIRNFKTKNE